MSEPQIEERAERPYLGIRSDVTTDGIRAVVDRAFPQLFAWLGEHGIQPSGPPFIRYHERDRAGEPLEIESAAPVSDADTATDEGRVRAGVLPAGRYVTLVHVGPYTHDGVPDLTDAQAALRDWTEEHGIVCSRPSDRGESLPCCVEHYCIGPPMEADWTKWETELAYLIVEG
jgi:effector-binding domain-containing protein